MSVESMQATLLADSPVTALVGDRVYQTLRPQALPLPAVVLTLVSRVPQNHLAGGASIDSMRVQVDSFAATRTAARELADACRAALEVTGPVLESELEEFEPDVSEFRVTQDFLVWT